MEEETRPAYMLLSGRVFAVCRQIANDFSNMSAASFLFHPIASFISSQGSALEISDRKRIEMLNRAFDIRPHNIQYGKQGPYDNTFYHSGQYPNSYAVRDL